MSEKDVIDGSATMRTRDSLKDLFDGLGLKRGDAVLVHSSLSRLGWVCGGPVSVVQALLDVLGSEGTLVAPAHTGDNTDPKSWGNPPVPPRLVAAD